MQKNKISNSFFILFFLVVLSYGLFAIAQENNSASNIFLDSDQDGLSDSEEKTYGTDPQKTDTDGDGYSDGAEVKGGYNPLKPAPGDKIIIEEKKNTVQNKLPSAEKNLTSQISTKVSSLVSSNDPDQKQLSLSELEKMVSESVQESSISESVPEIKIEDLKIKKQNYSKLSDEKKKEKLKEDATDYIIGLFYIFSSNSPYPITSSDNLFSENNPILKTISSAITTRNSKKLEALAASGEKMIEQMKVLEVPEDLVDIHLEAIRFAQYSTTLRQYLDVNSKDPVADLVNISKIQGFTESLTGFISEFQDKISSYGIVYDDSVKKKLDGLGIQDSSVLEKALDLSNSGISLENLE